MKPFAAVVHACLKNLENTKRKETVTTRNSEKCFFFSATQIGETEREIFSCVSVVNHQKMSHDTRHVVF